MCPYTIQELPSIEDHDAIECCAIAGKMRHTFSGLTKHIITQLDRHPMTAAVRVALACAFRINEASISVEYLLLKNRVRDSTILILSLYELQLDLQYIAKDISRANIWLEHTQTTKKPWSVAKQIRDIYKIQTDQEAEFWWYRHLSMAKHGNPVGGLSSFPLVACDDHLQYEEKNLENCFLIPNAFALGACIYRACTSASRILSNQGIDTANFASQLSGYLEKLSSHNEKYIASLIKIRPDE